MSRAVRADVSVFSVGGTSVLALANSFDFEFINDTEDGRSIASRSGRHDIVKQSARLTAGLMSNIGGGSTDARVCNLDISNVTIDSVEYVTVVQGGKFSVTNKYAEGSGAADRWKTPVYDSHDITINAQVKVSTSGIPAIGGKVDAALAGHQVTISLVIGGSTLTGPFLIKSIKHLFNEGSVQILDCEFVQRGAMTSTPSTPNLFAYALTDQGTALAIALTSRSSNGAAYTFNAHIESMSFSFDDAKIIETQYTFISTGAVAVA